MLTGWATWDTATLNARITVGKRAFFMNEKCEISLLQYNSQEVIDVWSEGRRETLRHFELSASLCAFQKLFSVDIKT